MAERPVLALRARVVLPLSRPPIENGAVLVSGNRIRAVAPWAEARTLATGKVVDLGDTILLPGLINAHCHLDYTDMAGLLPPPRTFTEWIHLMLEVKGQWNYSEYAASWLRGAHMLLRTGTTTVADIEAVPELLPEVWEATPLRVHSFLEMTGIRTKRDPLATLQDALDTADNLSHLRSRAALSPHAPYSTLPELIRASARVSRERGWPVSTIHLAESLQEFDMFMHGHGEMFNWISRNQRDMSDCGDISPVQHLQKTGALDRNLLAVHVNYLAEGDAELLGRNNVNVAHCPRSREYFEHSEFPYHILETAGVNICLGTDSLATVRMKSKQKVELSLLDEARAFAAATDVTPEEILKMATLNGARALGLGGKLGELSPNAFADVIAIPSTTRAAKAYEAAIEHTGPVTASMIDGRWAIPPLSL